MRYRTKPLFFEDFENGLPEGWTTIDNDGDGYNWISSTSHSSSYCHSGTGLMYSQSWIYNVGSLTPDNWLITSQLELQGTMKVWLRALDPSYLDHFTIYLSTTGNSVSDFTTVLVPETTSTTHGIGKLARRHRPYTRQLAGHASASAARHHEGVVECQQFSVSR